MKSVERVLDILELLGQAEDGKRVTEISQELDIPLSSVHRGLAQLIARGYASQDDQTLKYHLGLQVLHLKDSAIQQMNLSRLARQGMQELLAQTSQTVHLAILSETEVVYLDTLVSPQSYEDRTPLGARKPAQWTALGKAQLASLSDEEVKRRYEGIALQALTPCTITNMKDLLTELHWVREHGYAVDRQEGSVGNWCIAAPVHDYTGHAVAALSIAMQISYIPMEREPELSQLLIRVGAEVSSKLGYVPGSL